MPHADQVRSRARWRTTHTSLAWLLPLSEQPGLRHLVNQYQYALRELPGFDLVPLEWMHILLQEVGCADEIPESRISTLLDAARKRLADTPPLTLAFHRAVVLPESLVLPAEPHTSLLDLRSVLREACTEALSGPEVAAQPSVLPAEPEESDKHVTLAYSSSVGPAVFAVAALENTAVDPTTARVPAVNLVRLRRDHFSSEWESLGEVAFGG
jgi:2'-5' RNA ligase